MAPETQISDIGNETLSKGTLGGQAQLGMDQPSSGLKLESNMPAFPEAQSEHVYDHNRRL